MTLDESARAELLATFKVELAEHCQALTRTFLALEKEPEEAERSRLLDEAFRSAHSLKGAARSVGSGAIEVLAHSVEGALSAVRSGEQALTPALFDVLYGAIDALPALAGDNDRPAGANVDIDGLVRQLEAGKERPATSTIVATTPPSPPPVPSLVPAGEALPLPFAPPQPLGSSMTAGPASSGETIRLPTARLDALLEYLGELVLPRLEVSETVTALAALRDHAQAWQRDWRQFRPQLRQLEHEGELGGIRPLVRFLERNEGYLTTLVADLTALHRQLEAPATRLSLAIGDLQDQVKRLRLLPFDNLAPTLERAVRDLARSLAKEARLVLVGSDTELDRRVLEELKDPLLHLLRNALDHGIESPADRERRGKPIIGSIVVAAAQRGNVVQIEVEDDGAGLDPAALRSAAVARELLSTAEAERLSDQDALRLIFLPGFSSRRDVSEVSGRGIGLNIVAHRVDQLGGTVEVDTTPGRGTRFVLTVPLTLATTRAVLVEVRSGTFALATTAIERLYRVEPAQLGSVGGRPTVELEGDVLPIAPLAGVLDSTRAASDRLDPGLAQTVIVVRAGAQRAAIAIDRLLGEQEIVVKPLGYPLLRLRHFAGATILGAGRVVPILNAGDLVRSVAQTGGPAAPVRPAEPERAQLRVLVADDSLTTRTLERYILEAAGYQVELAGDGAEALSILQEKSIDLLVSDVNMPTLDGIGLTTRIRQDPRFRDLPIILVTSLAAPEDRERGLQAGADAYIVKSAFNQDHLLRTIRELV